MLRHPVTVLNDRLDFFRAMIREPSPAQDIFVDSLSYELVFKIDKTPDTCILIARNIVNDGEFTITPSQCVVFGRN